MKQNLLAVSFHSGLLVVSFYLFIRAVIFQHFIISCFKHALTEVGISLLPPFVISVGIVSLLKLPHGNNKGLLSGLTAEWRVKTRNNFIQIQTPKS